MTKRFANLFVCMLLVPSLWCDPTVWFCPLDPARHPGTIGSPQYMELFNPQAPWKEAASHVNMFKIYPQWIEQASDDDLKLQFADLNRRHIGLALEYGVLTTASRCSDGIQGEGGGGEHLMAAVKRIQRDGGYLKYVAMDEPIFFSEVFDSKTACHWSAEQMAANAAANIKPIMAAYPELRFGDVEPVGPAGGLPTAAMVNRYRDGIEAFKRALGVPLAFFHADVNWTSSSFPANLVATRNMVTLERLPFGVIYDGVGSNESDSSWVSSTLEHMDNTETGVGTPEAVIFQSWHSHPAKLLPETDTDSFTWLIDQYFRVRTKLTSSVSGQTVTGTLMDAHGRPMAGRDVRVSFVPAASSAKSFRKSYSVEDFIPPGTQSAYFGFRVNVECDCSGAADFDIVNFSFVSDSSGSDVFGFAAKDDLGKWPSLKAAVGPATGLAPLPSGAKAGIVNGTLQVVAQPGQQVKYTSSPFPVSGTGKFRFEVKADLIPTTIDSGNFVLLFYGAKGELARKVLPIQTLEIPAVTAKTDATGQFKAALPPDAGTASAVVATYAGGPKHWPASSKKSASGTEQAVSP